MYFQTVGFWAIAIFTIATYSPVNADCWWTGCQPNSWAVTGCAQYNRDDRGRQGCSTSQGPGNKYYCCSRSGGGGGGGNDGSGAPTVSFDQFRNAVTSNGYPSPSNGQYHSFMRGARPVGKISTKQELAMALAQFLHESDGLRAKREYACQHSQCPGSYRTPGCDAPGQYYYGRGYIQLSWCTNYRAASWSLFGDQRLVNDPDSVARSEDLAWNTAFWYWGDRVHNANGVQQGKFGASTRAINGKLECDRPGHSGPAKRFRLYQNVRRAFGLSGGGDPSGCR